MSTSQQETDFTQPPDYGNQSWENDSDLPHNRFISDDPQQERKLAIEPALTKFIGEEYYCCAYAPGYNTSLFQRHIIHPHGLGLNEYPTYADKIWSSVSGSKSAVSLATSAHVKYTDDCLDTLVQLADVSEAQ